MHRQHPTIHSFTRAFTASLCVLAVGLTSASTQSVLEIGPSPAFAANTCQHDVGSQFTGIYAGGYGAGSSPPASGIVGQVSINQPSFICNGGGSYWVMVNQPDSQCLQNNTRSVYAQAGWLIDGIGNPEHFYERADGYLQPNCDPGPFLWANAKWGGSHTYRVATGGTNQGDFAEFYTDGVSMNTLDLDWGHATNYQVAGEIHFSEEYLGGQTFRSLYHCEQVAQPTTCTPSTSLDIGSVCSNGNTLGCLNPVNLNGCYYYNSGSTGSNGFNIYEKRSKNPPSC